MSHQFTGNNTDPFVSGSWRVYTVAISVESVDDEDEVLLAIAENIGELLTCVGGREHFYTLLAPIGLLAVVEDSTVRDAVGTTTSRDVFCFLSCLGKTVLFSFVIVFGLLGATQAVKSVAKVVLGMPEEHLEQHFAPFVLQLASKDWYL